MRRLLILLLATAAIAGCATPYRPPRAPPPPTWMGASGLTDDGPQIPDPGIKRAGDIVASTKVRFVRTGVLAETVQTKTAYGGAMILPAGSKAFAENYTLFVKSGYSPAKNVQAELDPIEWCVVVPQGLDGKGGGSQTVCIFWESPEQARYIEDYTKGGFAFSPWMIGSASGMPGPAPKIVERPVDWGVPIMRQIRVLKVEGRGPRIGVVLSDGPNFRVLEQKVVRFGSTLLIAGAAYRLAAVPGDPAAVDVTPLTAAP